MQKEKGNFLLLVATACYTLRHDSKLFAQNLELCDCRVICFTCESRTLAVRRSWGQFCLENTVVCEDVVA